MNLNYIAGIVDGEGCISIIYRKATPVRPWADIAGRISVVNTYFPLLSRLKKQFGGHVSIRKRRSTKHKFAFKWEVSHKSAQAFCKKIAPFSFIKKKQAHLLLQLQELKYTHGLGRGTSKQERKVQLELYEKCKQLNKKRV